MDELDQLYEEFTIPLCAYIPADIEIRGITRGTLRILIEMERERGYLYGLQDGIRHAQEKASEMIS
ncbi:MAG TPA: hypothetical protein VGM30_10365 [Puia sp.]|jgi:hypothetical protein